jgi:hypothetical protein
MRRLDPIYNQLPLPEEDAPVPDHVRRAKAQSLQERNVVVVRTLQTTGWKQPTLPRPAPVRLLKKAADKGEGEVTSTVVDVTQKQWLAAVYGLGSLVLVIGMILSMVYAGHH